MVREDESTQARPNSQRCVRIFLGEDDKEMRHLVAGFLRHHEYEVIEADNGLELIHEIQVHKA